MRRRIEFAQMDASAQSLARLRGFALSAEAFRRLALANAVMLILIVATGATVRLTGSGLGCEHWPGCAPHHFEPKSYHSYIEFGNRVFAFLTILVTLATWLAARRGLRLLAFVIFVGTLLQAPLGALTVHFHLNPWLVLSHFLLSLVVLTLGVVLALEAFAANCVRSAALGAASSASWSVLQRACSSSAARLRRPPARIPAAPSSAGSGRSSRRSTGTCAQPRCSACRSRCCSSGSCATTAGMCGARSCCSECCVLQMIVGEVQYRTHLPWWLVIVPRDARRDGLGGRQSAFVYSPLAPA